MRSMRHLEPDKFINVPIWMIKDIIYPKRRHQSQWIHRHHLIQKTVRETKARTFYIGTDRLKRLDRLYKEMSLEYEIEFEEDLPKK